MYSQTGHRRQFNTAYALCMLDNYGYTRARTHSEYEIAIACHGSMVSRTHLIVTLYAHFLSCLPSAFRRVVAALQHATHALIGQLLPNIHHRFYIPVNEGVESGS